MFKKNKEKFYETCLLFITKASTLPLIRVNRNDFLRKQFKGAQNIEEIIVNGPQSVYSVQELREKAIKLIDERTKETSIVSFVSGFPSNPLVMLATGGADVLQYFGYTLKLAQEISYLFGEEELFNGNFEELSEETKFRIISYVGTMMGVSGAAYLVAKLSKKVGSKVVTKVATKSVAKSTINPIAKQVGTSIGINLTKKKFEKVATKGVPILGGLLSGAITYVGFRPMGRRLADVLSENLVAKHDNVVVLDIEE